MRLAAACLIVTAILAAARMTSAADLPTWKLAEMKGLPEAGWAPAAEAGGRTACAAKAGQRSVISVPVWWDQTDRPAEGTVYVLKVSYQDTATKPVVFLTHGGAGSYWGLMEVHRFGGEADGKWKTADVPVSWDLIMRKNAPGRMTELAIAADKDLPVESIIVTMAGPDAAANYFAETRAWIAKAQAEKRAKADPGTAQKPVLPAKLADQSLVPYVRTYLADLVPASTPQKDEAGATLKMRMVRNEYETGAFAIYANGKDLKGVTVSLGDLTGPAGKLNAQAALRTAEYAVVQKGKAGYRLYPQRYWPAYAVDIPAGRSHSFWVTLKTLGEATKPGKYAGKVNVAAGGLAAELPIEVEVVDLIIPTMQQAKLELGACGRPTLQDLKTLAEYNHTGMDIWFGGTQPGMKVTDGKLILDWYYLDDWMSYATKKLGMTHMMWFMGGDPYGFPDTLNLERDLYRAMEGDQNVGRKKFIEGLNAKPDKVLPEERPVYVDFIRQLAKHAKDNAWPRMIIHPFDEPAKWTQSSKWNNPWHEVIGAGKWINPHFKDACALIREGAKGYPNVVTGGDMHHAEASLVFLDDVTVFCTNAIHEDTKLGDKVRAAGVEFWQYSGCNDQAPAHRPRYSFGWYFAAYDSIGSLVWAYESMGRFDTSEGSHWGYGWYTPFGTAETPFMIGLREGWDDRRIIAMYKEKVAAKDPAAMAVLKKMFDAAVAQRGKGGTDTVFDFYAEIAGYTQMDEWRNQLIDALLKANN